MGQGETAGRHDREQARTGEGLSGLFRNLRRGRLADPDLRYRRVFECVSDGFALVEVIRDDAGVVVDYLVLDANPALMRILGFQSSPVGKRQSEAAPNMPPGWL